jgi:hypothetical protein
LDAVTGHTLAHGGEPTRSEIRKIDGGGFKQMEAGSQLKLQRSKFNKNHCANGVFSEDRVKKMTNLLDPLFNAEIKEAKSTQFFGAKSDASREMLIHAKFFQDSGMKVSILVRREVRRQWAKLSALALRKRYLFL